MKCRKESVYIAGYGPFADDAAFAYVLRCKDCGAEGSFQDFTTGKTNPKIQKQILEFQSKGHCDFGSDLDGVEVGCVPDEDGE